MHGRLKVKTTAEQEEVKRVEREKKVTKYTAVTQQIFQKRRNGDKDQSVIELTGSILAANPDFYTLWNYRREVYQDWKQNNEGKALEAQTGQYCFFIVGREPEPKRHRSENDMQKVLTSELHFIEQCLHVNPKSYGSWHQRCWVMNMLPDPNWSCELALCNKYLQFDERNFHCWDYRRFVVQQHKVSPEAEFDFTTDKISNNFSNYSSWHYRSKLLPLIHPDPQHPVGVTEDILLKEFELAQNAFFTDPNDQSAWFYHRWLLGRDERPISVQCAVIDRTLGRLMVVLTKHPKEEKLSVCVRVDGEDVPVEMHHVGPHPFSKIWAGSLDLSCQGEERDHCIDVEFPGMLSSLQLQLRRGDADAVWRKHVTPGNTFSEGKALESQTGQYCFFIVRREPEPKRHSNELSAATSEVLTQELEACTQLHELEPDNKWTMFTIVLLMRALHPLKYTEETMQFLKKLENIDGTRKQYYQDLRSKFIIENALDELEDSCRSLDLSGKGLTAVYHLDHMMYLKNIDFSDNSLTVINDLHYLQCVQGLNLTKNPVVLGPAEKKILKKLQ